MYNYRQFPYLHGFDFILADGRTFNAHGKDEADALDELKAYMLCEYGEDNVEIATVSQYN